jgi:hypothetical protein
MAREMADSLFGASRRNAIVVPAGVFPPPDKGEGEPLLQGGMKRFGAVIHSPKSVVAASLPTASANFPRAPLFAFSARDTAVFCSLILRFDDDSHASDVSWNLYSPMMRRRDFGLINAAEVPFVGSRNTMLRIRSYRVGHLRLLGNSIRAICIRAQSTLVKSSLVWCPPEFYDPIVRIRAPIISHYRVSLPRRYDQAAINAISSISHSRKERTAACSRTDSSARDAARSTVLVAGQLALFLCRAPSSFSQTLRRPP